MYKCIPNTPYSNFFDTKECSSFKCRCYQLHSCIVHSILFSAWFSFILILIGLYDEKNFKSEVLIFSASKHSLNRYSRLRLQNYIQQRRWPDSEAALIWFLPRICPVFPLLLTLLALVCMKFTRNHNREDILDTKWIYINLHQVGNYFFLKQNILKWCTT